jgi:DNA-binding HxlR family transcriptional regulator
LGKQFSRFKGIAFSAPNLFFCFLTPGKRSNKIETTAFQKPMDLEDRRMDAQTLPACPVETTLTLISDKWKVLILRDLLTGAKRFGQLKKSLDGVSQKVLTAQLRQMEQNGLLTRTAYPEAPPRVEYALTELGYSLKPVLDAMADWGAAYKAQNAYVCRP